VRVTFPDGAADEPLEATIHNPKAGEMPPYSLSGSPFAVVARGANSKNEIHQFNKPLTIEVACPSNPAPVFDPTAALTPTVTAPVSTTVIIPAAEVIAGGQSTSGGQNTFGGQSTSSSGQCTPEQAGMTIFYYDVGQATWLPLPTGFDPQAGVLRATSNHLTVFDTDANNWQAARLPGISSFQVAQFTGAATYSYPLWVPPGPGGLQPDLSLSYNSQVVDSAFAQRTQASWVGMGWSLDTGYIERDMHSTMDDTSANDDTYSINTNGISDLLLKGSDGYYHTVNESFWRIYKDSANDSWTVWDKVGNIYKFGSDDQSRADYPWFDFNCSHPHESHTETWRWALTEIQNPAGQKLTFSYTKDTKQTAHPCPPYENHDTEVALYPSQIDYPNDKYRVVFNLESRSDYRNNWTSSSSRTFYQQHRLNSVSIINVPTGTVMRKYQFSYGAVIYPGWSWDKGWKTFALSSIQELGLNGGGGLPATTFSYADGMHLSQANNGYGGKVSYTYDSQPAFIYSPADGYAYSYNQVCHEGWDLPGSGSWQCVSESKLDFNGTIYHSFGTQATQPGAAYRVVLHVKNNSTFSRQFQAWIQYDSSNVVTVFDLSLTASQDVFLTNIIYLPKNANQTQLKITCGNCRLFLYDMRVDNLVTRYRVTSRVVQDTVTGKSYTYSYRYDEPAGNDSDHSVAARDSNPYQSANSEFRGHVMSEEKGPDGRVSVTYYRQGDALKGNPTLNLVETRTFEDSFEGINPSNWTKTNQITGTFMGDSALINTNPAANWNESIYRSASQLADAAGKQNTALVQFRVTGAGSQAILALENLDGGATRRWGVWLKDNGSQFIAQVQYNTGSGWVYPTSFNILRDHWYVLQLTVDNSAFLIRLWDRDDVTTVNEYKVAMPNGKSWRFRSWAWSGTVYLDDYSEGHLYQVSEYVYPAPNSLDLFLNTSLDLPKDASGQPYDELKLYWPHQIEVRNLTYEGDGAYAETKTEYQYNTADQNGSIQYGNLTRQLEARWTGSAWSYYRAHLSRFYPNVSANTYIVGLPANDNNFECSPSSCAFAASDHIDGKDLIYDNNTAFNQAPTTGLLTAERVLLRFAGANYTDPRYSDTKYVYDSWGNRIQTSRYTGEGTSTALASSGAQTSYACYGEVYIPSGCTTDTALYHTFMLWEKNAKGQPITYTYDYTLALPVTQVDANTIITTVAYDIYGRLTKVIRSGDSANYPTLQVVYYDSWQPFMIDVHQRITAGASATYSQRKLYDGLGNLIQTQTPGAQLADNACSTDADANPDSCDLVTDSEFDAYGKIIKQTIAYPIQAWYSGLSPTPYRGQQLTQPATTTSYDILGRPLTVKATDAATTTYQYNRLETLVTDAQGNTITNTLDVWGNTTVITPPAGPAVAYKYDVADRLTDATRGDPISYTTHTDYDLAGRKVWTSDPDLGNWYYSYDILGNLEGQIDAKKQMLTFSYDALSRPTSKTAPDSVSTSFSDTFDSKSTSNWTWSSYQTVPYSDAGNNVVKSTGTGSNYSASFYRSSYNLSTGKGLQIRFKVDATDTVAHFGIESNDATYRRFAVVADSGKLKVSYTVDGTHYINPADLLASLDISVWYVLQIVLDDKGGFTLQVFKESDPNIRGVYNYTMPAGKSWRFRHWIYRGNAYIDDYKEFNSTVYTYDAGTNGIGHRTSMTDASGSTTWTYDARGRMTKETKKVGGTDTFVTQWSYNSADNVVSMYYPGGKASQTGEQVNFDYLPQNLINTVIGSTTYVKGSTYDAAGRLDLREIGLNVSTGNPILKTDYTYFSWTTANGQGRLKRLTTGTPSSATSLQDLRYYSGSDTSTYDPVGNLLYIYDYKAGNPQTQIFEYDDANRLTSSEVSGGSGGIYSEDYTYSDTTGNLSGKMGLNYTYDDTHKHGVRQVNGIGGTSKTISIRAYSTPCNDGIGATMQLRVNGSVVATWNNVASSWTTYSKSTPLSGQDVIDVVFTNDCSGGGYDRNLIVDYVVVDGQTLQAEGGAAIYDRGSGNGAFDGQDVLAGQQSLPWSGALRFARGAGAFLGGYDANGNMSSRVVDGQAQLLTYDAENHLIGVSGAATATFVYDGDGRRVKSIESDGTTVYIGNYWEMFTPASPGSVNLALGKPASQSSTYTNTYNPTANKAVDGNTSGNFFDSTVTSTNYEYQAWWQVDMGAVQPLTNVLLWNRTDCCSDRLSNFYVLVSDNPFVSTDLNATRNQSGVSSYYFANTGGQNPLTIPVNRTGRYLRVQLAGTNYLSLAEVQVQGSVVSSYYYAGDQRIAMVDNGNLYYLFADQLGSTSVVATSGGGYSAEVRYKAWGEDRYTSGTVPTSYRYTGQRIDSYINLYWYNSRWYDHYLNRWIQPDTIVPLESQGVQAWDRYAYANNNPVRFNDPSGHSVPLPPTPFSNINIPVSNGWDLVAATVCFFAGRFLPVHFESYGLGQGAIVGDTSAQLVEKGVVGFGSAVQLNQSVYRFGGSPNGPNPGIKPPRLDIDFGLPADAPPDTTMVGPETPPLPLGVSTYTDPKASGLSGYYYSLPKGTQLPEGLGIVADGKDVLPTSPNPPTHNTIFPTIQMFFKDFVDKIMALPWSQDPAGKR
jgi:RHS repeat-associated protein